MKREHEIDNTLPSDYIPLEYIQNTGTQYIGTDMAFNWDNDLDIYAVVAKADSYNRGEILGAFTGQYVKELNLEFTADNKFRLWINNGGVDKRSTKSVKLNELFDLTFSYTASTGLVVLKGLASDNTIETVSATYRQSGTSPKNNIFTDSRTTSSMPFKNVRIAELHIRNGNAEYNFVAALRTSDNKPGLYDLSNDRFYTNSGTGEFLYK